MFTSITRTSSMPATIQRALFSVAAAVAAVACAAAAFMSSAGTALAPEAGRLNYKRLSN